MILCNSTNNGKNFAGLHFTLNHTGKMAGMQSLSTSVLANHNCEKRRAQGDSICAHCFAATMMKRYASMQQAFIRNTEILNKSVLPVEVWPTLNTLYFRLESFGDLVSWIQAANYFNFAKANPGTRFALWTKNPWLIAEAIKRGYSKPENLNIILSSTLLNKPVTTRYNFVDKVFTVYDKKAAQAVNINCGARSCATCLRCHKSNPDGKKVEYVNELLK